jgi:hypothetical protein
MSRTWFVTLERPSSTVDDGTHAASLLLIMTITIIPNYKIIFPRDYHESLIGCH